MAVAQPPNRLQELERTDEILLRELERVDEILLDELDRVDEMLLRISAAIDKLPERIASAGRSELGSAAGEGTRAAERAGAAIRPFDPYGEDEVEATDEGESPPWQAVRKVQSWIAAYSPDRGALRFATVSLALAWLATTIAVIALIVAALY